MSATMEVVLLGWVDINVLFVLWRIFRAGVNDRICIAPLAVKA